MQTTFLLFSKYEDAILKTPYMDVPNLEKFPPQTNHPLINNKQQGLFYGTIRPQQLQI